MKQADIPGLLMAAELALSRVEELLPAPIAGSHKDKARIQLASALQSIDMIRYHLDQMERNPQS